MMMPTDINSIVVLNIHGVDYPCIISIITKIETMNLSRNPCCHVKNMNKEIATFGDINTEKRNFHCYKNPIFSEAVDIDNILLANNISCGKKNDKYFIVYTDDDYEMRSFTIILSKTCACVNSYDGKIKWIYFLIKDNKKI